MSSLISGILSCFKSDYQHSDIPRASQVDYVSRYKKDDDYLMYSDGSKETPRASQVDCVSRSTKDGDFLVYGEGSKEQLIERHRTKILGFVSKFATMSSKDFEDLSLAYIDFFQLSPKQISPIDAEMIKSIDKSQQFANDFFATICRLSKARLSNQKSEELATHLLALM